MTLIRDLLSSELIHSYWQGVDIESDEISIDLVSSLTTPLINKHPAPTRLHRTRPNYKQ